MFTQRWSTLSLLCFVLAAAFSAFYAGRRFESAPTSYQVKTPVIAPRRTTSNNPITASATPPKPTASHQTWEMRWAELRAEPSTPSSAGQMADWIEQLAKENPQRALSIAAEQGNLRLRATLLQAALRTWSQIDPQAALAWAQSQKVMDQAQAIENIISAGTQNPDAVASLTLDLIQTNPDRATEFAHDLISSLSQAGNFEQAAKFATEAPSNYRDDWMTQAYSRWAEYQPEAAANNAMQIADAGLRNTALGAIITGWAPNDPKSLIQFAKSSLPPEQQDAVFSTALNYWAGSDPIAAATWISQNSSGRAADGGRAGIALSPMLSQSPQLATDWAASILNPNLRIQTLKTIVTRWANTDLSGAENFVQKSPSITEEDRTELSTGLQPPSNP